MTKTFEIGRSYKTRSICDSNCWFSLTVVGRTAKTIKANVGGKMKTLRLSVYAGAEFVKPYGSYSMAPIINAED